METDYRSLPRRRHAAQFKAEVVAACLEPGVSVAEVARRFGLNDNLVHQWRRGRGAGKVSPEEGIAADARRLEFVPVSLPAPALEPATPSLSADVVEPIRIEIRRGGATVDIRWPTAAAGECAAWLRELLR